MTNNIEIKAENVAFGTDNSTVSQTNILHNNINKYQKKVITNAIQDIMEKYSNISKNQKNELFDLKQQIEKNNLDSSWNEKLRPYLKKGSDITTIMTGIATLIGLS